MQCKICKICKNVIKKTESLKEKKLVIILIEFNWLSYCLQLNSVLSIIKKIIAKHSKYDFYLHKIKVQSLK